jgi:AcrR family transcriptional regulator
MIRDNGEVSSPPRRDVILQTAAELFAESSYHGVGMRAIADAVGIRSSSLYYHFPSKMDILHAIALDATKAFVESQLPRLDEEGSHAERLRDLFRAHVKYFYEHRVEEAVGLRELRELEAERTEEVNAYRRRYQRALVDFVEEGAKLGEFHVDDAFVATMAVLNMINGVNEWFRAGGKLTIDAVADRYAAYAVEGILGAAPVAKKKPVRAKRAKAA